MPVSGSEVNPLTGMPLPIGQAGDGVDQVPQGPAEAVQLPDDQGVTGTQLIQNLLEDGAVGASPAGGLDEHPVAASASECVELELRLLIIRGDAGVAKQVSHAADRLTTLRQRWLCDVDFGHGFWTPLAALAAGE
jgi:hypothetical protein